MHSLEDHLPSKHLVKKYGFARQPEQGTTLLKPLI